MTDNDTTNRRGWSQTTEGKENEPAPGGLLSKGTAQKRSKHQFQWEDLMTSWLETLYIKRSAMKGGVRPPEAEYSLAWARAGLWGMGRPDTTGPGEQKEQGKEWGLESSDVIIQKSMSKLNFQWDAFLIIKTPLRILHFPLKKKKKTTKLKIMNESCPPTYRLHMYLLLFIDNI